jgi:hypothetical protein
VAIRISSKTGPEPVMILLAAGAKPYAKNHFRSPVYFARRKVFRRLRATPEVLRALMKAGADPRGNSSVPAFNNPSSMRRKLSSPSAATGAPPTASARSGRPTHE